MTEHTGRHASSQDQNETLIMPAIADREQPAATHRAAGRHSSGSLAADDRDDAQAAPSATGRFAPPPAEGEHPGEPASFRPAAVSGEPEAGRPEAAGWQFAPDEAGGPDRPAAERAVTAGQKSAWSAPTSSSSTWGDRDGGPDWPDTSDRPARDDRPARNDRPARDDRPSAPVPAPGEPRSASPAPAVRGNGSRGPRPLRLVWVYPDLMSTYGDRGNLLVLVRRAGLRGYEVEPVEVKSDEPVPEDGDIYLLGGGEDLPQILAANRLRADSGLNRAVGRGAVVFAVCAGYQLLGRQFGGVDGEPMEGLGIIDVSSGRGEQRGVGEIVADVDPALGVPRLTGFENHQGVTRVGPGARPLARVSLGVGNGDGTEGAYAGKVLGTYLHGPALARNPGLADLLLSWVVGPLGQLDPQAEDWARQLREERLAATAR